MDYRTSSYSYPRGLRVLWKHPVPPTLTGQGQPGRDKEYHRYYPIFPVHLAVHRIR